MEQMNSFCQRYSYNLVVGILLVHHDTAWLQERERQLFSGQEWCFLHAFCVSSRDIFKREVTTNLIKWRGSLGLRNPPKLL